MKKEKCMFCKSKNLKLIRKGLETDLFRCMDCKKEFGISYMERWWD